LERLPRGKYTREFREETVRLVTEDKLSVLEAARRLGVPHSTIDNWLRAEKEGRLGDVGKLYRPLTELELELARVKKENAELRMERDILKKAAAYFAREQLGGTRP
jgi:transposase-like protein